MKKVWNAICDVAVTVGCAVGVGLISGKETQIFAGNYVNAFIFAAVYFAILSVFREFCRKKRCDDTYKVARACFGKKAAAFNLVICACGFVCVTTCLAGAEQCLGEIFNVSPFPLYAVAVATLSAVIMLNGMRALKAVNVVSIAMTLILFVSVALTDGAVKSSAPPPKAYMPVIYALFTLIMSFGVICKTASEADKKQNILRSGISAAVIAALLIVTFLIGDFSKPLPTIGNITNPVLLCYAGITIALSAISGIVSCAYPIMEQLQDVIPDKTVCAVCIYALATAFSMFGFDFAIKFGYALVGIVGGVTVAVCAAKLLKKPSAKTEGSNIT